ncbi:hypothetical protein [Bradyrhizobium liaoningense]|uniref:hypothetical protein n=1 Tax=Bradyrhizobium liaoningense TaxID=43992 RepID=UPI0004BA69C4|nr:hypothetical protein [Bradyrhizobium liaoningense]
MAGLRPMPKVTVDPALLQDWGAKWRGTVGTPTAAGVAKAKLADRFDKKQGMDFGYVFDAAFGKSLAEMLGGIAVMKPDDNSLLPPHKDCVEVGKVRIVGGIRPQNYDAAYRPDGPRVVYDSKTLNDRKSIAKNWQNMVNDLATEASTVHTRFPYCLVCFIVVLPRPALMKPQEQAMIRTLERLGSRDDELDQPHLAEGISMVIWDPDTGAIDPNFPPPDSVLRIERMSERVTPRYLDRYKNLPPHEAMESADEAEEDEEGSGIV